MQSAYTIDSNPHGLAVSVDGTAIGNTPQNATPAFAAKAHVITITPSSGTPYTVAAPQTANGAHAVFYNQQLDTAGKIASIASSSVQRRTASVQHPFPGVRRIASRIAGRPAFSTNRLTVAYDPRALAPSDAFDAIERRHGVRIARTAVQSAARVVRVVTLAPGTSLDAARHGLAAERGVRAVEPVRLRYPLASTPVYPNDSFFNPSVQWDLYQIGAPTAWGYGKGKPSVAIAVIDTGYDPNQPQVAPNVTLAEKVLSGYIDSTAGAATDTDGHGTLLSAIASAVTNDGAGWAGVAWGASLQEYKVFPDGAGATADSADVAAAIREATGQHANVILLAFGGTADAGPDPFERDAVNAALAAGIVVVAAAGNDGASAIDFPAGYDGVVAVGASALDDSAFPGSTSGAREYVPTYSNATPSLVAPGGDPTGPGDTDQIHWIENAYTTQPAAGIAGCAAGTAPSSCGALFSGTSVAAAHVAGAAGLLLSQNASLSPAQVTSILTASADDVGDARAGHGRLDLRRAMALVMNDNAPFPKYVPKNEQFVAFSYTNVGANATRPTIADVTFPHGVPVNADGTFRIADLPAGTGAYRIAVWYDANGDGVVDAGDFFGVTPLCATSGACTGAPSIAVAPVGANFVLP